MLGLTPDPLSVGVGMHVAVAGPYTATHGSPRGRMVQTRNGRNTRRGFRFVWPSTRAGRRPRPPVANDRLRHLLAGDARVSRLGLVEAVGKGFGTGALAAIRTRRSRSSRPSAAPRATPRSR